MSARKYFREVFLHDDSKRTNKGRFLFSFVLEPIEVLYADNLQTLVLDARVHKFGVTTAKNIHVVVKEEEFFAKKFTLMKVTYRDGPMTPSMIFVRIVGVDWYLIDTEREESITSDSSHALQMLASEYLHISKSQQQMIPVSKFKNHKEKTMISVLNHQVRVFFPDELQGTLLERTFMLRFGTVIRTELREEVTHFFTEVSVVHKGIIEDFDISEGVVGNEEVFTLSNKKYTFHFLMELPIGRGTETAWKVLIGERWLPVDIAGGQGLSALYVRYKKSNSSENFIFTSPSQWY